MKNLEVDDRELVRIEAIINSMTQKERVNPDIISGSRKKRIAAGSGTQVQDVNRLLKQHKQLSQAAPRILEINPGRALIKALAGMDLGPAHIDVGKLTVKYQESGNGGDLIQFLQREVVVVA